MLLQVLLYSCILQVCSESMGDLYQCLGAIISIREWISNLGKKSCRYNSRLANSVGSQENIRSIWRFFKWDYRCCQRSRQRKNLLDSCSPWGNSCFCSRSRGSPYSRAGGMCWQLRAREYAFDKWTLRLLSEQSSCLGNCCTYTKQRNWKLILSRNTSGTFVQRM